ncbi:hypothetical protein BG006_006967 [Podila minutissima]|uniref:Uncharacterized protein n=1 Tax=Podila minutissima TaxID=64525 RepID=A0A9P5SHX7_9FUNG|nr:hypothetical protein BG006_006967 [Podila minutissima]
MARLSNATTTHFSSPRQFMTDEANNLFLATSPKAVRNRTPRNNTPKTMESPILSPFLPQTLESSRPSPTEEVMPAKKEEEDGAQDEEDETMEDCDDESIETASTHSSLIDHEKENTTPKFIEDHTNPFLVGGTSALLDMKRAARGQGKADIMLTPSGPSGPSGSSSSSSSSQGVVRRSKRLALDSLSPWRWNLEEQYGLPPMPYSKNGKGQGLPFIEGCGGPITKYTGQNAVSDWIETTSNRSSSPTPESSSSTGGAGSSTQRNRLSNGWTTGSSSSSSSSSSSPSIAGPSSSKGAQIKIPDHLPNSFSFEHRQPSATVAKVTQKIIQPASLAFNRRAQQVAGRIYYWKNGGYNLVNEQDKQQWPGEWKFDVYQDPESPDAVSTTFANNNAGASMPIPSSTSYLGKGKLTDRQLSGPASKRRRLQRESSSGLDSSPSGRDMDIQKSMTPPPSHPTSPAPGNKTPRPQGKLQDRYDFRERRMLNSPLSTPSRRSMA